MIGANDRRISLTLATMIADKYINKRECDVFLQALRDISLPEEPNDVLHALKDQLIANPEDEMSLANMAAFAHVGKYHLIRIFKKRYGLTPRAFLAQNRVRKFRRNLPEGTTLTSAALSAGFYDQSHFISHFKRLHGMTPRQYLSSLRYIQLPKQIQQRGGMNLAKMSKPSLPASTE